MPLAAVLLLSGAIAMIAASYFSRQDGFRGQVFRTETGWGYDIYHDGDKIIHQPYAPGISGNIPFPDRRSARSAAEMVAGKLSRGEYPGLSERELSDIL